MLNVRMPLFIQMFKIAEEHAKCAAVISGKQDNTREIREAMISILFSYNCLEAYINTIGIDYLKETFKKFEDEETKKHTSTTEKWKKVPKEIIKRKNIANKKWVFDSKDQPFKDLFKLEEIRKVLVHTKQDFVAPTQTKYGNFDPVLNYFTSEKANWAIQVVNEIRKKIEPLLDDDKYPNW